MQIDYYDFDLTAQTLWVMNPSVRESYNDWADLKESMIEMAYQYCDKSNSFGISGYCLTAFTGSNGERHVKASVQAYTAAKYLERIKSATNFA